jgi:hypothetical protein
MATGFPIWNGEPYPGFFRDQQFPEPFKIDHKWMTYEDKAFEGQSMFAELNQAILEFIHFEKRFPNKDELTEIRDNSMPTQTLTWDDLLEANWPKPMSPTEYKQQYENEIPNLWGKIDNVSVKAHTVYEPVTWGETFEVSWEEFIKSEDKPTTALASLDGINKYTLNHELL